jgi:hypothetical protein
MGLDDLVNKAKDMLGQGGDKAGAAADGAGSTASGMVDKIKEVATDERIDQVAGVIKDKTPDNVDSVVDTVAEKAKDLNN